MKRIVSRLIAGIAVGVAVYVGFSIYADVGRVGDALRSFHWQYALYACLLAATNYAIRFGRWQIYTAQYETEAVHFKVSIENCDVRPGERLAINDPGRVGVRLAGRLLPWPEAARLGELAPESLAVPSGSRIRIDYPDAADATGRPGVAVKLQECFGWAETPRLADGRVPVLFHLLSPARRPLAVTDDLASFWSGPYAQVRAEMRGRYPRHPWPEDPWTAHATARTKPRN